MILVAAAIIDRNLESFQSRAGSPRILDVTKSPNVRLTEGGHIKIPNDPFIFHRLREALGEDSFNTILSDSNLNMVFKLNSTKAEFK